LSQVERRPSHLTIATEFGEESFGAANRPRQRRLRSLGCRRRALRSQPRLEIGPSDPPPPSHSINGELASRTGPFKLSKSKPGASASFTKCDQLLRIGLIETVRCTHRGTA